MNVIVIGLGSMGRRRIRLIKQCDPSIKIIGVDTQGTRCKQASDELDIETMGSIGEACGKYSPDIAFVSTSPLSHAGIIRECLENNLHVFTELNLVDTGYDENIKLADEKDRVLFLSSTFLYRKEIEYIRHEVKESDCKLSYVYHAGQYLPDWHPWESYKNFFVGDKRTNGCREFMAIEFPWLIDVFGKVTHYHSIKSKDSSLDIGFPDTYQIMLQHKSGHKGLIQIDVVSRKAVRNFELSGENLYLTWNGTPDGLRKYDFDKKEDIKVSLYENYEQLANYSSFVIEDAYLSEIKNFIDVVKGRDQVLYSFEEDKVVLDLINKVEGGC